MKILPNVVINFHAVYDKDWMEKVFMLLNKYYNLVFLSDIEDFYYEGKQLNNACHITFDDGDTSFYNTVFPLLKKHKIPVSIYVSPQATIERENFWFQEIRNYDKKLFKEIVLSLITHSELKDYPLTAILKTMRNDLIWEAIRNYRVKTNTESADCINMNIEQLSELYQSGLVSIGAHTLKHPILKNESDERATQEVNNSISDLSDLLGIEIKSFAYPNGNPALDYGDREIALLKENNVKLAFSTLNKGFCEKDNPFSIPRRGISYGNSSLIVSKLLLGDKWDKLKRITKGKSESDYRIDIQRHLEKDV